MKIIVQRISYKYTLIFPIILGLMIGFSIMPYIFIDFAYSKYRLAELFLKVIFTIFFCFLFTFIFFKINKYLKGIASFKETFALVSYSLIPIIIGLLIRLLFQLYVVLFTHGTSGFVVANANAVTFIALISPYWNYFLFLFALFSFYLLMKNNSKINAISINKSFIASFLLGIIFIIVVIFTKVL